MQKTILAFCLLALAGACSSTDNEGGNGGGGNGGSGGSGGGSDGCPGVPAYTGMACQAENEGPTCPGTAACFCDEPINIETTCVCQDDPGLGKIWVCGDDCASACAGTGGGGTGGTGGSSAPVATCAEFCAHLDSGNCPQELPGCEDTCNGLAKPGCEDEMAAYMGCAIEQPVICDPDFGFPGTRGCPAEDQAFADCNK